MRLPNQQDIVEALLKESGTRSPPVKLAAITRHWKGLQVTLEDIESEAFFVDLGQLGTNILIKEDSVRPRQRFSLAHELGHLVLSDNGVLVGKSSIDNRDDVIERWCNEFASELLMPTKWIRERIIGISLKHLHETVHKIAELFETSLEAAMIRIAQTTPVNIVLVEFDQKKVVWKPSISRESSVIVEQFKAPILKALKLTNSRKIWFIEEGLVCAAHAMRKSGCGQQWTVYLVESDKSLTIASSGHAKSARR